MQKFVLQNSIKGEKTPQSLVIYNRNFSLYFSSFSSEKIPRVNFQLAFETLNVPRD